MTQLVLSELIDVLLQGLVWDGAKFVLSAVYDGNLTKQRSPDDLRLQQILDTLRLHLQAASVSPMIPAALITFSPPCMSG